MPEFTYLVSPDFDPTVVPEGYIWDETAFKELAKATDKAVSDQTIYTYGGAQGDSDVVYENAADLTISNRKYDAGGQVVDTTITANTFNNTGMVTTDGVIVFSVQNFSNSGTFNLDSAASVTFNDAVTNAAAGTINLNDGSTLQGTEIGNAGTIAVVSSQAAINAAITNSGLIDAGMNSLTVTGNIENSTASATTTERDNSVIRVGDFTVTGNIRNYGLIGTESQEAHTIDISGELRNYRQIIAGILTAGSICNDGIYSDIEDEGTPGCIIAGKIVTGVFNNFAGEISTGLAKEDGKGIDASGKINNGKADAVYAATIQADDNGWI